MRKMTDEEYVADGGRHCPWCGGADLWDGEPLEFHADGNVFHPMHCENCEKEWCDEFRLVGFA